MKKNFLAFLAFLLTVQLFGQTTNSCTLPFVCVNSSPVELVTNGDFSQGNVGFTSNLPLACACQVGSYCVAAEARDKCTVSQWINDLWDWDQNNASGSYLIIDGTWGNTVVWSQNVSMVNGQTYLFSFNVLPTISSTNGNGQNLSVDVNGQNILLSASGSYTQGANNWNNRCATFTYTGPSGTFPLTITQNGTVGNSDYGIDGISLMGCCSNNVQATQSSMDICCGTGEVTIGAEYLPTGNIYWTNGLFTPVDGWSQNIGPVGGAFTNLPPCVTTTDFGPYRVYKIDPCQCSPGTYNLGYSYNNGNCTNSATMQINIGTPPAVGFNPMTIDLCNYNGPVAIYPFTNGVSCSVSGAYTLGTNLFDAMAAGVGTHTVDITCVSADGCSTTIQGTINVVENDAWHQTTQNATMGLDAANDVITDGDGNVYVVGEFADRTVLRGGPNASDIVIDANISNASSFFTNTYVAKYNRCGDLVWAANSVDIGYNKGYGIAVDENNGVLYITGYYRGSIKFGNAQHNNGNSCTGGPVTLSTGTYSGYVAQFNMNDGCVNFVESVTHNSSVYNECHAITIDENDGDIFVGGRAGVGLNNSFMFVHKYAPVANQGTNNILGNLVWHIEHINTSVGNYSRTNDLDYNETTNAVWMIGTFKKDLTFSNSTSGTVDATIGTSAAQGDAFYAVYSDNGNGTNIMGARPAGAALGGMVTGEGVAVDEATGSIFFTGSYRGTVNDFFSLGLASQNNPNQLFSYMIGIDATGGGPWIKSGYHTSSGAVQGTAVDVIDGRVYFAGHFVDIPSGLILQDINSNTPFAYTGPGGNRLYMACYAINSTGAFGNVTQNLSGSTNNHLSRGVAVDRFGHAYTVGAYTGTVDYLNGSSTLPLISSPSISDYNAFVIRSKASTGAYEKTATNVETTVEEVPHTLTVYPNPTTGKFTVETTRDMEQGLLEVLDITGKVIATQTINNKSITFDLTTYPQGIYIVKLTAGDQVDLQKVIHQ